MWWLVALVRAASEFERIAIAGSLWKFEKPIRTSTARRSADHLSEPAVSGEATSSEFQLMTYPCYVGISKHSPPTTYHGAWAGFGLRQLHWLILKCNVEKSIIH